MVYPDPSFSAQQGYDNDQVYPNGWWLPSSGVQEGTILSGDYNGDPLTPGLPATAGIYRRPVNESKLPSIPSQAISYGDAMELLRRLGGIKLESFIVGNPVAFLNCEVEGRGFKSLTDSLWRSASATCVETSAF